VPIGVVIEGRRSGIRRALDVPVRAPLVEAAAVHLDHKVQVRLREGVEDVLLVAANREQIVDDYFAPNWRVG